MGIQREVADEWKVSGSVRNSTQSVSQLVPVECRQVRWRVGVKVQHASHSNPDSVATAVVVVCWNRHRSQPHT